MRQLVLRDVGDALEVVVTRVAEVRRAEAEEDGHAAAVATLVLEEVRPVLRAHLQKTSTRTLSSADARRAEPVIWTLSASSLHLQRDQQETKAFAHFRPITNLIGGRQQGNAEMLHTDLTILN